MIDEETAPLDEIGFCITPEHECSYLDDREVITLFVDPNYPINMKKNSQLEHLGFRRKCSNFYRLDLSN